MSELIGSGISDRSAAIQRINELEQELSLLRAMAVAADWIVPMAKGYANEHRVGSNQEIVNQAENALAAYRKFREGKG